MKNKKTHDKNKRQQRKLISQKNAKKRKIAGKQKIRNISNMKAPFKEFADSSSSLTQNELVLSAGNDKLKNQESEIDFDLKPLNIGIKIFCIFLFILILSFFI